LSPLQSSASPHFKQLVTPSGAIWDVSVRGLTVAGSSVTGVGANMLDSSTGNWQAEQPQPKGTSTMQKTVLVVEDNELNMKLFNDLLEAHGYKVVQTRDGLSALEIARKHMPDLILMDIQLPEVSGIEVTKWLKEDDTLRSIPVIAVTAFAMKGDEQKIREGGCEAYISKPISVMSFLQTIDKFAKR
jgi:two-component system, cell cycle response regulator DivK